MILENVHGLTRESFRPYLDYIFRQLSFPSIEPSSPDEEWLTHDSRLARHAASYGVAPEYNLRWAVLNAADYGVPQVRTRVVIIATRREYPVVELPAPTHSRDALIHAQQSGVYWETNHLPQPEDFRPPKRGPAQREDPDARLQPWRTVREALVGLPAPSPDHNDPLQHWLITGARLYRGHKGSLLDWPSKTIKAGVHGVAGGENIVHLDDGSHRYFTIREMARLQGFPDSYAFCGPRSRVIGQIGNAVPCGLAEEIGRQVMSMWRRASTLREERVADHHLHPEVNHV